MENSPEKTGNQPSQAMKGCMGCLFIIVVIFVIGYFMTKSEPETDEGQADMAYVMCQEYVKKTLKAPSTADFPWSADYVGIIGEHRFKVQGHVDAQNLFGAMIRTKFVCIVRWEGPGSDNWYLQSLDIK